MLGPQRTVVHDFFDAPNRWVGIRSNNVEGDTPILGDGVFEYVNQYDGETSVEARNGLVITQTLMIEAADQTALEDQVMNAVGASKLVDTTIEADTDPNPLHWHFDRVTLEDKDIGGSIELMNSSWKLPLDGGRMSHIWQAV